MKLEFVVCYLVVCLTLLLIGHLLIVPKLRKLVLLQDLGLDFDTSSISANNCK